MKIRYSVGKIFLLAAIAVLALFLVAMVSYLAEPSCEDLGGKLVPDGTMLMPYLVGKTTVLIHQQQYRCEGAAR